MTVLVLSWLALAFVAEGASAQTTAQPAPQAALDAAETQLKTVERSAARANLDDSALQQLDAALPPIEAQIRAVVDPLRPQLQAADARLAALGPAPKPGAPSEAASVAQNRAAQASLRASLDAEIKRGDLLLVETDQLGAQLSSQRIDAFSRRIGARSGSVLDPRIWTAAAQAAPRDLKRWAGLARREVQVVQSGADGKALAIAAAALIAAFIAAFPLRRGLERLAPRLAPVGKTPERLRGAELGVLNVLIRTLTPTLAAAALVFGLSWAGLLSPQALTIAWAAVRSVGFAAAAAALGGAVLSPDDPDQRLLGIGQGAARAVAGYPLLVGAASALGALLLHADKVAGVSLQASIAARGVVAIVELLVIALAVSAIGRARAAEVAGRPEDAPPERGGGWWTLGLSAAWLALAAGFGALVLGYVAFAGFLAEEVVWIAGVAAVVFVLTRLTDELFGALSSGESVVGGFAVRAMGLSTSTLDQLSVLLAGLARLVLWLLAWTAILTPFGAGAGDVFSRVQSGAVAFKLGGVTVSPAAIAGAIGLFVVGVIVTGMFRRWLETRYLPRTRLDVGLTATVGTGVSYFGGLVALLIACAYLGLKLTQVTLFASALTVGIGFGLQSVIQNFVAGMILLAGRPIRVGDWIAVGEQQGDVQRINVRATEIRLFDGSVLILPNQELVTKPVRNVTWGSPLGQIKVVFSVPYDADLDQVGQVLLEAMKQTKGVLKDPAPAIAVTDFRDTGAVFEGTAYVASPRAVFRTKSDILFELARRLREAGVKPGVDVRAAAIVAGIGPAKKGA